MHQVIAMVKLFKVIDKSFLEIVSFDDTGESQRKEQAEMCNTHHEHTINQSPACQSCINAHFNEESYEHD